MYQFHVNTKGTFHFHLQKQTRESKESCALRSLMTKLQSVAVMRFKHLKLKASCFSKLHTNYEIDSEIIFLIFLTMSDSRLQRSKLKDVSVTLKRPVWPIKLAICCRILRSVILQRVTCMSSNSLIFSPFEAFSGRPFSDWPLSLSFIESFFSFDPRLSLLECECLEEEEDSDLSFLSFESFDFVSGFEDFLELDELPCLDFDDLDSTFIGELLDSFLRGEDFRLSEVFLEGLGELCEW